MRGHKMTKSVAPRLWLCAIATAVLAPLLAVAVASHTTPPALADAVTGGTGSARDGWVNNQPSLSPTQVTSTMFGQLYSTALDGQVYAQPVTYDNTVVVATENDTVAGINESDGVVEWSRHLGIPWNTADVGCSDISPTTGITGTPVVEPNTGTVYLVTKSYVSGDGGDTQFEMHALDVLTGLERPDWPVVISGSAANDTNSVFAPEHLIQRPALLLMNGVVYAAFGGFCDTYPYQGWIAGVSTANAAITTLWTTEPATGAGSIWQSGSGLASDGPGQILFATGNGTTPPSEAGQTQPPPTTLGQSIVRVGVHPDGSIATTDFYAPADAPDLNPDDLDLGSGGVSLLPDQMGTASDPHLLVQGGKSGELYLLNRDDLGGRGQGPGGADAAVDEFGNNGGIWSTPAAWPGDGGWLYDPTTGSPGNVEDGGGKLYAYQESVDATGAPTFSTAGSTSDAFPYGSSSAVVSSDGTTSGSALVWIVYMNGSASELRFRSGECFRRCGARQWERRPSSSHPPSTAARSFSARTTGICWPSARPTSQILSQLRTSPLAPSRTAQPPRQPSPSLPPEPSRSPACTRAIRSTPRDFPGRLSPPPSRQVASWRSRSASHPTDPGRLLQASSWTGPTDRSPPFRSAEPESSHRTRRCRRCPTCPSACCRTGRHR